MKRIDGRGPGELRRIQIDAGQARYAEGSAEVRFGNTHILITASVEKEVPKWLEEGTSTTPRGWITAEYGMLPRATHTRNKREASQGKQSGRTLEIQRLIGRALRSAVDLSTIPGLTIRLDCDVLCADGGTRTAAISGGWVALAACLEWCQNQGLLSSAPEMTQVAAISVGRVQGVPVLDLCYEEDSTADFDLNIVQNSRAEIIEVQGTAEGAPLPRAELGALLELGHLGITEIFKLQKQALKGL